MATYNIKNQEDFNRVYSKAPVKERGQLGYAFPEYYQNYQTMDVQRYQDAMAAKGEKAINQAIKKDVREELLKSIAGKPNKYFTTINTQQERNKLAQGLKNKQQPTPKFNNQYQQMIYDEAKRQGVDPNLAMAVAYNESKFNPNAKNITKGDPSKGTGAEASYGLFQINTLAHPDYKGGTDPKQNIAYGVGMLKNLLKTHKGDVKKVLERYNGSGAAAKRYSNVVYGIYQDFSNGNIPNVPGVTYTPSSQPTTQSSTAPVEASKINLNDFKNFLDNNYSSQNAQEGALNNPYDISDLDLNRPALMGQQMARNLIYNNPANDYYNASGQFYKNTYDLARQAGGYGTQPVQPRGQEDMMNEPYFNNQMAPVPNPEAYSDFLSELRPPAQITNEPQNIRADVLDDYIKLIDSLRGQQDQQGQALMAQLQQAQRRDNAQNAINAVLNNMNASRDMGGSLVQLTPNGTPFTVQMPGRAGGATLPTNTTGNMDAFKNQLALQAKNQQNNKDLLDRYQAVIAANEMSKVTGLPPGVFLNNELYKTYAQYIQSPEVKEQAQFKREAGMAPINLSSDLSKQSLVNAGNLDVANLNAQANLSKTGLAGEYTLANTKLANAMQGANQYRNAMLNANTQQNINKANLTAQVMIANMNNENKLKIAQQMGANAQDLAVLQDSLYSDNPLRQQQANAALTGAMANLLILGDNPEQGFSLYDRIINGGSNQGDGTGLSLDLWND